VLSRLRSLPGIVRVRAGLLEGNLQTQLSAHFHVAHKPNWWPIVDGLPQYPTGRIEKPVTTI
jgi:hypothetical protein